MPQLKQVELKAADKADTTQHNNKNPKLKRGEESYFVMMASNLLNAEGPSWKLVSAGHISGDAAFILS